MPLVNEDEKFAKIDRMASQAKAAIFVTGDSTTSLNPPSASTGLAVSWADIFSIYVNSTKAVYCNRAFPGYSLREYHDRGSYQVILEEARRGDVFLVCHGHLEGAPIIREDGRARGCLPGLGDEVKIVYDGFFRETITVHTFGWYLKYWIGEFRDRGISPIFLSPPVRCAWNGDKVKRMRSIHYADAMREVCRSHGACFMDFAELSEQYLNQIGKEQGSLLYTGGDLIHTNVNGAEAYAELLAENLLRVFPKLFSELLIRTAEKKPCPRPTALVSDKNG